MLLVVGALDGAAAIGFIYRPAHGVGHAVGVKDGAALQMSRRPAHGLDERAGGAQETLFVSVEDCDQRDFRQVEAFTKEIDANEDVVLAFAEASEELDALEGFDLGVHVAALDADFGIVAGEVL